MLKWGRSVGVIWRYGLYAR